MKIINSTNAYYPEKLKKLNKFPENLHTIGNITKLNSTSVGIIGTRKISEYGRHVVLDLVPKLVSAGFVIVSGLAPGIDSTAHESALLVSGSTIGVLGFGFNFLSTSFCKEIAKKISLDNNSTLVSAFPNSQRPEKWTFIERNKIIAALSDVLVVVEAPIKSGTSYTVNTMLELGRDVYAVPGSIFSYNSKGTHALIKSGAILLDDISDISSHFDKN